MSCMSSTSLASGEKLLPVSLGQVSPFNRDFDFLRLFNHQNQASDSISRSDTQSESESESPVPASPLITQLITTRKRREDAGARNPVPRPSSFPLLSPITLLTLESLSHVQRRQDQDCLFTQSLVSRLFCG